MSIKTTTGYRVLTKIPAESLDLYIKSFTSGSGETILVGKSDTLDLTITRGTRTSDGAGNALQIQGGQATGTNQVGGDVNIYTGYPTGNAAAGDFKVFGALSKGSSGTSVNPSNSTMLSVSGDTGNVVINGSLTVGSTQVFNSSGIIQTAAQTNITSLGTLTGLTTSGDVTVGGDLTVSSGTSGDATLIIEADTDNNNESDSPRLWFKADGDIIEGAIQHKDNTFDIISNVSANGGIRFLTGTTNNTGTTDPETGATERMSIASNGDVAITGSLQPNTIELGHASDTTIARSAAGKVTIEGANVQTTQICCTHHNMSLDGSSSTVDYYFPINSLADGSSSSLYYTRILPAYDGKIVKILVRASVAMGSSCTIYMSRRGHDGTSTSHQTSGFQASETFDGSTLTTVIVPCGVGGSNAADWVFEEGDQIGLSIVKNTTGTTTDLTATIVWEYTV